MGQIIDTKQGTRGCAFNNRFNFETIGSSSTAQLIGIGQFLPNCDAIIYSSSNETMNFSYSAGDNIINLSNNENDTYNGQLSIVYTVDKFGVIINSTKNYISYNSSASYQDTFTSYSYPRSFFCIKNPKISSCEPEPETNCQYGGKCGIDPTECEINPGAYACSQDPNDFLSCTQHTRNDEQSSFISGGGPKHNLWARSNCNYSFINKLSEKKDWSFFFGLAKQSSNIKLNLLDKNQSQNCAGDKCEGDAEGCWVTWYGTTVLDTGEGAGSTSATSQRWKTRVRKVNLNDEELQNYTIKVESKYYLQIPVEGSDPIRILVDSGTDTFSGNQSRGGKHEFTNEDFQAQVGQPVYGCINITSVLRL